MRYEISPAPWTLTPRDETGDETPLGRACRFEIEDYGAFTVAIIDNYADALLIAGAPELRDAARHVIASWERGDLAAAVRRLQVAVEATEQGLNRRWTPETLGDVLYNCCTNYAAPDWERFDAIEIGACQDLDGETHSVSEAEAEFWTVYGRLKDGDAEAITDCKTRLLAEEIAALFEAHFVRAFNYGESK